MCSLEAACLTHVDTNLRLRTSEGVVICRLVRGVTPELLNCHFVSAFQVWACISLVPLNLAIFCTKRPLLILRISYLGREYIDLTVMGEGSSVSGIRKHFRIYF